MKYWLKVSDTILMYQQALNITESSLATNPPIWILDELNQNLPVSPSGLPQWVNGSDEGVCSLHFQSSLA